MPKSANPPQSEPRTRLAAVDRRKTIIDAARASFEDVGDITGTTMRTIAERAGISEGVIYRHFESKEQLFYEAVVEPLRVAVDSLVRETEAVDADLVLTSERQHEALVELYSRLTATLADVLPMLGLVLFGDPEIAKRFYREHFAVAMDRLAGAWADAEERHGLSPDMAAISARAVMGGALITALEQTYAKGKLGADTFGHLAAGAAHGYFPPIETG